MLKIGWMTLIVAIALPLLTACETRDSKLAPRLVLPKLEVYSPEFQNHLADEMEVLAFDCPRDFIVDGCSALATFTLDHIHLRDKVRAAENIGG